MTNEAATTDADFICGYVCKICALNVVVFGINDFTNKIIFEIDRFNKSCKPVYRKKLRIFESDETAVQVATSKYSGYTFVKVQQGDTCSAMERCLVDNFMPDLIVYHTVQDGYTNSRAFAMFAGYLLVGSYFIFSNWNLGSIDDLDNGYSIIVKNLLITNSVKSNFRGWVFEAETGSVGVARKDFML